MALFWIAVALVFAVAEILTLAFYAVFVVLGALAGAVAALLGFPLEVQVIVSAVVALAGVVAARPVLMRYLRSRRQPELLSGAESMIGKEAQVVDEIRDAHTPGHVRITGENWPAIAEDGGKIAAGKTVRVVALKQATLVVTPVTAST